ncbi:hypothetical protein [Mangrovicella endophytica]|uniref:hypothetical protein n=1 Tax=Mangrovicella endophytica TaxID=2066697 RepID=UPI000C9E0E8F|nr:hypothetical protein [Mangrovicella endophytica]
MADETGKAESYEPIAARLAAFGLCLRGGFRPDAEEALPPMPDGSAPATLLLVGNAGPDLWRVFTTSPEFDDGHSDALDRWSQRVLTSIAEAIGAAAYFPFGGPPHLPFQQWAKRSEPLHPSPLGLLIHPRFGLWHAYRGALALGHAVDLPPCPPLPSPCESCRGRPCLTACPVGAFTGAGYDVGRCRAYARGPEGEGCRSGGCRARLACPFGQDAAYGSEQMAFHMRAFLEAAQ